MRPTFDNAGQEYQQRRITHWDDIARKRAYWRGWGKWYHRRLDEIYQFLVNPGQRILEIGCGDGDLLASLKPSQGVGVDFSPETIYRAQAKYPGLEFIQGDAHDLSILQGSFDVIILSDTLNDLWDVQSVLEQARRLCTQRTRLILNFFSGLWQLPLMVAQSLNLATTMLPQNWLTLSDVHGMLTLTGFEVIRTSQEILWPLPLGGFLTSS